MLHQIQSTEWREFLGRYSRIHRGLMATLEIRRPGGMLDRSANHFFRAIRVEENDCGETVYLDLGNGSDATHIVRDPSSLFVERGEFGDEGMTIRCADGTVARMRFVSRRKVL
jgi:hypothetical protein